MTTLFAAIDCGTTAVKCALVDPAGDLKALVARAAPCQFLSNGHIESSPEDLLDQIFAALKDCIDQSGAAPADVVSISLSTQRATVIPINREGNPAGQAISWQDMRGTDDIEQLRGRINDERYYHITGLPNNPVFTLGKILWIKNREPERYRQISRFSLVHDFVLKNLGCDDFFSDLSNAALTGLLDITRCRWSQEILDIAGIEEEKLPTLVEGGTRIGALCKNSAERCGLLAGTPLISGGGDQQCAGLGAGAVAPGILEFTLGTAGVPLVSTEAVICDPGRRVTCCVHAMPGVWEVEGLQNSAGASLKWLRRIMRGDSDDSGRWLDELSATSPGANGILFYPFLTGSSAPHWNPRAKAMFLGLTQSHTTADMIRAVMEGVSLETRQILEVFSSLDIPVSEIRLTGGYTNIGEWNQIQADIFGRKVCTLLNPEASLLGAALLGAVGAGAFPSIPRAVEGMVKVNKVYSPQPEAAGEYNKVYKTYCEIHDIAAAGIFDRMT